MVEVEATRKLVVQIISSDFCVRDELTLTYPANNGPLVVPVFTTGQQ